MSISEPFVRRPIATSLLMGGIFLVGLVVFPLLPVAPLPQVDFPTIQVSAQLPGASPETMAATVATPLEYQFAQISGLSQMTSTNLLGNSQRRGRPTTEKPADTADLPQGQPRRLADSDLVGAV